MMDLFDCEPEVGEREFLEWQEVAAQIAAEDADEFSGKWGRFSQVSSRMVPAMSETNLDEVLA